MARRGRFGRLPRVAPNLSTEITSIARAMQAQRDQNIMDAWKNGGTFEGSKVTDDMVLAYWKSRLAGIDKNDPLHDAYANNILQLQYGIEQSKMDLRHLQGKVSDKQYAQFFLGWAKRVPRNSEFYRVLQKDAARLIEAAKARARAGSNNSRVQAYNDFVNKQKTNAVLGEALTDAAYAYAKATGLTIESDGARVLDGLTRDIRANPAKYQNILDAAGQGWDGVVSQQFFSQAITDASLAYDAIATRSWKEGYTSNAFAANKSEAGMAEWGANIQVWPIAQSYENAYGKYDRVMSDPAASWLDKAKASQAFADTVNGLAATPNIDPATAQALQHDAAWVVGDTAEGIGYGDARLGGKGISPAAQAQASLMKATYEAWATDSTLYTYAPVDAKGNYDPLGQGALGVVPSSAVSGDSTVVPVPTAAGQAIMAAMPLHKLLVADPNDPKGEPIQVGNVITYNTGGRQVTLYGYPDASGTKLWWTTASPLAAGVTTSIDNKGNTVAHLAPPSPEQTAAGLAAAIADVNNKFGAQGMNLPPVEGATATVNIPNPDGSGSTKVTATVKNGTVVLAQQSQVFAIGPDGKPTNTIASSNSFQQTYYNGTTFTPEQAAAALSPSLRSQGRVPGTTFDTPIAAAMKASVEGLSYDQVNSLAADPTFQQAFLTQAQAAYGTFDVTDQRIANAWKEVTTVSTPDTSGEAEFMAGGRPLPVQARKDLRFPEAVQVANANKGELRLTFGANELRVPAPPGRPADRNLDIGTPTNDFSAATGLTPAYVPALTPPSPYVPPVVAPVVTTTITPGSVNIDTGQAKPTGSVSPTSGSISPTGGSSPGPYVEPYKPPSGGPKPL